VAHRIVVVVVVVASRPRTCRATHLALVVVVFVVVAITRDIIVVSPPSSSSSSCVVTGDVTSHAPGAAHPSTRRLGRKNTESVRAWVELSWVGLVGWLVGCVTVD
jgi:hypothetical protein